MNQLEKIKKRKDRKANSNKLPKHESFLNGLRNQNNEYKDRMDCLYRIKYL